MKKIGLFLISFLTMISCTRHADPNLRLGNEFIDAFYSFDKDKLRSVISHAQSFQGEILYYQQWAKCANYKVLDRDKYLKKNDSTVVFPVTVKDDLMGALKIDFNVTDTFHITIKDQWIVSVKTSSNDLPDYYKAKEWVKANRPEYVGKQCEGIWAGGPTPCECVLGMIKGFEEFTNK